jgi:predicted dienelactone hydrolase
MASRAIVPRPPFNGRGARTHALLTTIWYPAAASAREQPLRIGRPHDPQFDAGRAAHGYIAAAVNHPGNNALAPYTVPGFVLWWLRARDLSAVLDHLLADPEFGPRIDPRRIGAAGFSLGGYTRIELAGGTSHPQAVLAACAAPGNPCKTNEFPGLVAKAVARLNSDPAFAAAFAATSPARSW